MRKRRVLRRSLPFWNTAESARRKPGDHFNDYDLVITTYGTLTRDALHFKNVHFDYCILDEAQAIKNAGTLSAKAARLLKADRRLALSGTPVENHLGELWSLFEFLNPGMLGGASVFGGVGRNPDVATRTILARACGRSFFAAPKERWPKSCRQKPSRRFIAISKATNASFMMNCAIIIELAY